MIKYDIGYTTGVFDLFHAGHVNFLKQVKALCNYLIVGICSDKLTYELKEKWPVYSSQDRLEILESIKFVDHVFIKNDTDKYADWGKFHFNAVLHGDLEAKFRQHEIRNRSILQPFGVEFIYFDRDWSISTTDIIKKIRTNIYV